MAPRQSVAIRLGIEGQAEVRSAFAEMGQAGDAAATRWGRQFEQQSAIAERAIQKANIAAQRIMAVDVNPVQARVDRSTGVTGGQSQAAAMAQAQSLAASMAQAEAQARNLLAAIDPVIAAQMRYGDQVDKLDGLLAIGGVSEANYQRLLANEISVLDQVTQANSRRAQQEQLGAEMAALETAELQRQQGAARGLISAVDPLFAAQQRFNQQMQLAFDLYREGALGAQRYQQVVLGLAGEVDAISAAELGHGGAAGRSSIAMMELEHVVRGASDSYAAGLPPMTIFTSHLGMLAQAASLSGEQMGAFGRFMGGGWGLLITAGVTVLGTLIAGHHSASDAAHEHETTEEALARAMAGEEDAIRRVTDALRARQEAAERLNQSDTQRLDNTLAQARADIMAASATRGRLIADLQTEQARSGLPSEITGGTSSGMVESAGHEQRAQQITEQLAVQTAEVARNTEILNQTLITTAGRMSEAAQRVSDQFSRQRDALIAQATLNMRMPGVTDADRQIITGNLTRQEEALNTERDRSLQVVRDNEAAERRRNSTLESGRHINEAQAAAIIRSIGGTVTSTGRSHETQARLYRNYLAGRGPLAAPPGSSAHEGPDPHAIDFTGVSLGQVREAFRQHGVSLRQLIMETNPITGGQHGHADFGRGGSNGEAHAATLARQSESREVDAQGELAVARAYLVSSAAGAQAEAARRGLTAATRDGTDASVRQRQALDLETAQVIARGAQGVAQARDETVARAALNDRIAAGTLNTRDLQTELQDEAAIRPLLARQALAHGAVLEDLNRTIDAQREAFAKLHAEERHGQAVQDIVQMRAANDNGRAMLAVTGSNDWDLTMARARAQAEQEATAKGYVDSPRGNDRSDYIEGKLGEAHNQLRQQAVDQFRQQNGQLDDQITLLQTELGLGRMGETQRQDALHIEQQRLELQRRFGPENQAEIVAILDKTRAEQQLEHQVERVRAAHEELNRVGSDVVDQLFNIDDINNWGDTAKKILREILQEMLTMAAANPLKNLLFGSNLPTIGNMGGKGGLGGILGSLGSLFGGGGGGGAAGFLDVLTKMAPGAFAVGTDDAPGGLAWVAENGPELINLPRGSKVTPAGDTRRMLASNNNAGAPVTHNHFHLEGAVMTEDLVQQMNAIGDRAADNGAARGVAGVVDMHRRTHGRWLAA